MPIQNTKLVMSNAHATGMFEPHTPTPVEIRYVAARTPPVQQRRGDEERRPPPVRLRLLGDLADLLGERVVSRRPPHERNARQRVREPRNVGSFAPAISCVSWAFSVMLVSRCLESGGTDSQRPLQGHETSRSFLGVAGSSRSLRFTPDRTLHAMFRVRVPHPRQVARPRLRVQLAQQQVLALSLFALYTALFGSSTLPKVIACVGHAAWHAVTIMPSGTITRPCASRS